MNAVLTVIAMMLLGVLVVVTMVLLWIMVR